MDPNAHEAFDRLKEQGKVRFLGVSTHTPNLEQVARTAIASGRFDVMMLAYHHGIWANLDAIIRDAAAHGIGVVAMKTLKGARHENLADFRADAASYAQAAFRWVLSNPDVGCLVVSFARPEHVDEYLYASGGALTKHDVAVLERYDARIAGTYCHPHCGACLSACPERLAISTTCCATGCTSRATGARRKACGSTPCSTGRPTAVSGARRPASRAVPSRSRSATACSAPIASCGSPE